MSKNGGNNFEELFAKMLKDEQLNEKALDYLHDEKKIEKEIIYNELFPKKLLGYWAEKNSLAFPLVRGFLVVGIQYIAMEKIEVNGQVINEGEEYLHEGSDVETGIFNLQRNFREAIITSGILDLLSADYGGASLPSLKNMNQLKLFLDINTKICFKNTAGREEAHKRALEILPDAKIIPLPEGFNNLHELMLEKGKEYLKVFLHGEEKGDVEKQAVKSRGESVTQAGNSYYFETPGEKNTEATLRYTRERARQLKVKNVLVSSRSGDTAYKALEIFGDELSTIIVTHATGFMEPGFQELSDRDRMILTKRGAVVFTAQHAFAGVGRAVRNKTGSYQIDEIIAYTLRTFGQGTKVAIEIALMAADAGLIRIDEDIISVGGTVKGVDTALLLRPAHTQYFFDLKVREVICKPFDF
jgi:uncharacterized protein